MGRPTFLRLNSGATFEHKGRPLRISHVLDTSSVLIEYLDTGKHERLSIDDLCQSPDIAPEEPITAAVFQDFSTEEWKIAENRYNIIRPLLEDPCRTRSQTEDAARAAGVHPATIYEWMKEFLANGHISVLIPRPRGRRKGSRLLDDRIEAIIEDVIDKDYLSAKVRATPQEVCNKVKELCKSAKLEPLPHPNSIRNRLRLIPQRTVLARRGYKDLARYGYEPIKGKFPGADTPLSVVQIDHTPANVIVVHEETRLPMGRPWVTLAIDVNTRMVAGLYVSMEHPSATAVGICISRCMLPKGDYLRELDITGDWPIWGKMGVIHCDNAKEFRGKMLERGCEEYSMVLQLRPVKKPHFGGHIERLMGTTAGQLLKLPGKTFSSPEERTGYDSEKNAALTLRELEQYLVEQIVNVYHQRPHAGLNKMPPIAAWERGILGTASQPGIGLRELPNDPERIRLDFLPFDHRSVQQYGIRFNHLHYYHEVLSPWINAIEAKTKRKRMFLIRYDPRDISRIYFSDPVTKQYFPIPLRNLSFGPLSHWEVTTAVRLAHKEGLATVNEDIIFESIKRSRSRIDEAVIKTKQARRAAHRQSEARRVSRQTQSVLPADTRHQALSVVEDIFATPVTAFSDTE